MSHILSTATSIRCQVKGRGYVGRENQYNAEKGLNVASRPGVHTSKRHATEAKSGKRAGREEVRKREAEAGGRKGQVQKPEPRAKENYRSVS